MNVKEDENWHNGKLNHTHLKIAVKGATKFTDNTTNPYTQRLQRILNTNGASDKFGKKLKEDGVYGPKTAWAFDRMTNKLENEKENAKSELNDIIDKQYETFKVIDRNKEAIFDASAEFGIPPEIIGSIMLKEGYTRSIPDWLGNITSTVGNTWLGETKKIGSIFKNVLGAHSTGPGAIFPNTARKSWVSHLGKAEADKLLPSSDLELQYVLSYNERFNVHTIAAVLANEAKRFGYNSKKDLSDLKYSDWSKIIPYYNGDPYGDNGDVPQKYGRYVTEYLEPMKKYLK